MFNVFFKDYEQFIEGLIALKEIGALGENVCIATYLPNNEKVDDIISGKINVCEYTEYSIVSFSICVDKDTYRNKEFKNLYGINHLFVNISTEHDVEQGDVFKRNVKFENMIPQSLKLIK